MKATATKIMLVDDHPLVLEGMKTMLATIPSVQVVCTASRGMDALEELRKHAIEIVFADISMPDMNGIELCGKIKKEFPQVQVIALSTFTQRSFVSAMLAQGASAYLVKSADRKEIEEAIEAVMAGKMYFSRDIGNATEETKPEGEPPMLTRREKEVLVMIAQGLTNSEIAEKIFVSTYTVDTHRKNLLAKFEVGNTALLIKKATEFGLA